MTPLLLLTALLALVMGSTLSAQELHPQGRPLVQTYGPEAYDGSDRVWKVLEGEAGWIWLLTPRTLHGFDGIRWHRHPFPRENGGHLCMAPLAGGGVVLGAEGNLASCAPGPRGEIQYRSLLTEEPGLQASLGRMRFLERTKDGYYFTDSTRFGFFRIDSKTGLAKDLAVWGPQEDGAWKRPPVIFFKALQGEVWIEFLDGGLGLLGEKGPELVPGGDFFAKIPFSGVEKLGASLLIATFTQGLYLFEDGVARPWETPASELCRIGNPSGLMRLDTGLYVLSTRRKGIVFFDEQGRVKQHIDVDAGLPSNSVYSDPELDSQKGLWIPTGLGVARLQLDSDLTIFDRQDGLRGEIRDIELPHGRLHVLTDHGIFRVKEVGQQHGSPVFEALPPAKAPPTKLDWVGDKLIVGTEMGLFSFDPTSQSYSELVNMSCRSLETDQAREWIFLGTNRWGLVRLQKQAGIWKVHQPDKPTFETCLHILLDETQDAWAHLVDQRGRSKLQRFRRKSGYREFEELTLPGRGEEGPWELEDFFFYEKRIHIRIQNSLYRWDESAGRFAAASTHEITGLTEVGIDKRPLKSRNGLHWFVGGERGIYLYQETKGRAEVLRPLLRAQDAHWNCWLVDSTAQTLWAGDAQGLLVRCRITDPTSLPPPPLEPRFSSISIVDHDLIHGGHGPLPLGKTRSEPDQNHYRFAWSLPSFEGSNRIRYRTRLVGLEEDWTAWSTQVDREFLSLPSGSFEFEVEARDSRGRLTPRLTFPFSILSPWYQSLWSGLLFILGGGLILFSLLSWRNRRVYLRVQRLETEIAQRQDVEKKLEESQNRYRSLVETTSDLVWEMDVDFCYLYASPRFEDQLGYGQSELMGRSLFDLIEPTDQDRVRTQLNYSRQAGTPFSGVQYEIREKTGRTRRMESNGVPVFDNEGQVRGFRGIDRDVTERQAAEDQKRDLEDRLRQGQKLESLGRLAGGVAHDFNNILTAILGHAEIVRDFCKPGTEMTTSLYTSIEEILRAGRQAADLTGRLLAFSRQQILRPRVVDPGEVLQGLERMLQRLIREDIEIVLELAPDAGSILVDGGQLEQVIINLVVNSVDAMPDGGWLTLRTERVIVDKTHVALHPGSSEGVYVRISVADTGHGMDQKTLTRIFEPFFTTKDPGKGTGLGLASTHGIVQQSGGHIHVSSKPGEGTSFELYFPVVAGDSEDIVPEEHALSIVGTENILVCDDDPAIRSVAERSLAAHGYRVRTAAHAAEALEILGENDGEFDLLITDLIMPGMNGKELAEQVRNRSPEMPVLFASGYTADIILDQSELPPKSQFLPKPFTAQDLLQRVRQLLDS